VLHPDMLRSIRRFIKSVRGGLRKMKGHIWCICIIVFALCSIPMSQLPNNAHKVQSCECIMLGMMTHLLIVSYTVVCQSQ